MFDIFLSDADGIYLVILAPLQADGMLDMHRRFQANIGLLPIQKIQRMLIVNARVLRAENSLLQGKIRQAFQFF